MTLGDVYLLENKTAEARAAYERYLAIQPDGPRAADVRAVLQQLR
jgi:predicted negative regulator of RcsB-dependent stress response